MARKLMTSETTPEEGRVVVGSLLAGIGGRPASATVFGMFWLTLRGEMRCLRLGCILYQSH